MQDSEDREESEKLKESEEWRESEGLEELEESKELEDLEELEKSGKMEEGEESEESEELEEVVKSGDLEDRGEWVWSATRARAIANRRSKRQSSCFRYNTAFYFKLRAEVPNCFSIITGQDSVREVAFVRKSLNFY